jgi:hypothetical protein
MGTDVQKPSAELKPRHTCGEASSREQEERQAAQKLLELTCGYWISQSIAVVAELRIADLVRDGPKHVEMLARSTGTKPRLLYRVMRALASCGIFVEEPSQCFGLTPMAELLTNKPGSLRGWAILLGQEDFHRAWDALSHTVRTGEPGFNHVFGMNYWDYLTRNPKAAAIFNDGLTAYTSRLAKAVAAAYDFSGVRKLVDVGAGHGVLSSVILNENSQLRAVLFDLQHAREGAIRTLAAAGVADRAEVVSGDFFRAVPEGGDAYLLSHIIHDWDDERALAILQNCRRVMTPEAKLLLVEAVIPPGNQPFFGKLLDVHMMVATDQGTDRTEDEYRSLLKRAGFRLVRIVPTSSHVSVIESVLA